MSPAGPPLSSFLFHRNDDNSCRLASCNTHNALEVQQCVPRRGLLSTLIQRVHSLPSLLHLSVDVPVAFVLFRRFSQGFVCLIKAGTSTPGRSQYYILVWQGQQGLLWENSDGEAASSLTMQLLYISSQPVRGVPRNGVNSWFGHSWLFLIVSCR